MKLLAKQLIVVLVAVSLAGCQQGLIKSSNNNTGPTVGPSSSTQIVQRQTVRQQQHVETKLDVVIPVFSPGLDKENGEKVAWPELRRAEATKFAWLLKETLDETGRFGAVRVTPDVTAVGEIYVLGRIEESNGESVEITLKVSDISGRDLVTASRSSGFSFAAALIGDALAAKSISHDIEEGFFDNPRKQNEDPYQPLFDKSAAFIVSLLDEVKDNEKETLKKIADVRFASSLSDEAFAEHMSIENGRVTLNSLPAENDATYQKIKTLRVRDQLFVDKLQNEYQAFYQKFDPSHRLWQTQLNQELEAKSKARKKAFGQALGAVALIGLAVVSAKASAKSSAGSVGSAVGATGAVVAGVAGASKISDSLQSLEEAEVHSELIEELGDSINIEVAPQVVEFEESQAELVGDASEQFAQWRAFLKKIVELEQTPQVQL